MENRKRESSRLAPPDKRGISPGCIRSLFSFEGTIFFSLTFLDNCIEKANGKDKQEDGRFSYRRCNEAGKEGEVKVIRAYGGCLGAKSR